MATLPINNLKIGQEIILREDGDNAYKGKIIKLDSTQIHLEKCQEVTSQKYQSGPQSFDMSELCELTILTNLKEEKLENSPVKKVAENEIFIPRRNSEKPQSVRDRVFSNRNQYQHENSHLKRLEQINMKELLSQRQIVEPEIPVLAMVEGKPRLIPVPVQDATHQEGDKFKERESFEFTDLRKHLWSSRDTPPILFFIPDKFYFFDTVNEDFKEAIEDLENQRMIGVNFEGQLMGRSGVLSLVSVSTPLSVYVFDVVKTGFMVFDLGLTGILKNPGIMKIVHDSRKMSDYCQHVLKFRLDNVYDTLAAHISYVTWSVFGGHVVKYSFSISHIAKAYLGIKSLSLFFPHYRKEHLKQDTGVWLERPLIDDLLLGCVRNTMFLFDLQAKTREAMLIPFTRATQMLLSDIRDADDADSFVKCHSADHTLSQNILDVLPDWRRDDKINPRYGIVDPSEKDRIHNCVGQLDPKLIFSRDTMHMNRKENYL